MYFFTSRRVSVKAICMWSAVVTLCTMPSAVQAQPIEARLADMIARTPGLKRMCNTYCHFLNPAANPSDPLAAVVAEATPVDGSAEEPAATAAPEAVTPPQAPPPTVAAVEKTSAALNLNANISPLLVWAVAGTGGAILAIF